MTAFKSPDVEENVACNLIPMIDIMFLLLLFFMLGADMSQRELEEVVLPVADQAQEEDKQKAVDASGRTTINVFHQAATGTSCPAYGAGQVCREITHWLIAIRGKVFTVDTIGPALDEEANLELEDNPQADGKPLSAREVMIRADEHAPFGFVQRIMETCSTVRIYKIQVAAARPEAVG